MHAIALARAAADNEHELSDGARRHVAPMVRGVRRTPLNSAALFSKELEERGRHRRRADRDSLLRLLTAGFDAVDGSSTGTEVPSMWALLRLPRFGGANHADGHDNRPRHCKVGF